MKIVCEITITTVIKNSKCMVHPNYRGIAP